MVQIREIPADVSIQINDLQKSARELLRISDEMSPKDIVTRITEYTRQCINQETIISDNDIYAIGALLGCQYVQGLGWSWKSVDWTDNPEDGAIGVLNEDKSMFNNPIGWVSKTLEESESVTFLLSYNMIEGKTYPKLEPNSATPFY